MKMWPLVPLTTALLSSHGVAHAADTWVGSWAASPQSSNTTFNTQTLRQIVHTSIGGQAARVHLSNAFGNQAVTIGDVHIAQRGSASSITPGTDKVVSFGGQTSVTIQAGAEAVSDSIAITVAPLSDIAVSMYFPQSTGPATSHGLGEQTSYVTAGDTSGNATLTGATTNTSYYFLANLDVLAPSAGNGEGAVVTLGASITDGFASTGDANARWPNVLASRLANAGRAVGVLNQGISGNRLLVDGAGQSALNRFDRDVLAQPGVQWVIFSDDPINDLGSSNPPPKSTDLIAAISQLVGKAHQKGLKFYCSTLTPYEGAGYWSAQGETEREAINAFVRGSSSGCDGVVDQDTATHDPAAPTKFLPAYDSGDHLHPNDAGYRAIANAVNLALFDIAVKDAGAETDGATEAGDASTDASTPVEDASHGSASDGSSARDAAAGASAAGDSSGCAAAPRARSRHDASMVLALAVALFAAVQRRRRCEST